MNYKGHFEPTGLEIFPSMSQVIDCDNKNLTDGFFKHQPLLWSSEFRSRNVVKC